MELPIPYENAEEAFIEQRKAAADRGHGDEIGDAELHGFICVAYPTRIGQNN